MQSLAEKRSLALHREVAARLRRDPRVLDHARERLRKHRKLASMSPFYLDAWEKLLERDAEEVASVLELDSEWAHDLRQVSPFAGVLGARERWAILRRFRLEAP